MRASLNIFYFMLTIEAYLYLYLPLNHFLPRACVHAHRRYVIALSFLIIIVWGCVAWVWQFYPRFMNHSCIMQHASYYYRIWWIMHSFLLVRDLIASYAQTENERWPQKFNNCSCVQHRAHNIVLHYCPTVIFKQWLRNLHPGRLHYWWMTCCEKACTRHFQSF